MNELERLKRVIQSPNATKQAKLAAQRQLRALADKALGERKPGMSETTEVGESVTMDMVTVRRDKQETQRNVKKEP